MSAHNMQKLVWHDLRCQKLKYSLSASNFKAEIAFVCKMTYVTKYSD